jgi:F0F1-type ATP synthase assembly protein I
MDWLAGSTPWGLIGFGAGMLSLMRAAGPAQ